MLLHIGGIAIYGLPWAFAGLGLLLALGAWCAFQARRRLWRLPGILMGCLAPLLMAATYTGLPIALTNSTGPFALANYPSWQYFAVLRLGVNAPGDAPPQWFIPSPTACTIPGGDIGSEVATPDGGCMNVAPSNGPRDAREWGVSASAADNSTALQAALAYVDSIGGALKLPPGQIKYATAPAITIPAQKSLNIYGEGIDVTMLSPAAGVDGLDITAGNAGSLNINDLSILAGGANSGVGLKYIAGASTTWPAQSTFRNLVFRGKDAYSATDYWTAGIQTDYVSNILVVDSGFYGSSANQGIGFNFTGGATLGVIYNFTSDNFGSLAEGIALSGNNIQGVSIAQSNFTPDTYGVYVAPGLTGLDQLAITGSQFGYNTRGLNILSAVSNLSLSANLLTAQGANQTIIYIASPWTCTIVGNAISAFTLTGTIGIDIEGAAFSGTQGCIISGNTLTALATAVKIGAINSFTVVGPEMWSGNTANIIAPATDESLKISGLPYLSALVSGAVSDGAGGTLLTVGSSAGFVTGESVLASGVGGVTFADTAVVGPIKIPDATHIDLYTLGFAGTYTSGGVVMALP